MIIWDTGPLFAAADVNDRDHGRCVELMRRTPGPLLMLEFCRGQLDSH